MEESLDEAVKIISKWENYEASSDYCPNTSLFNYHSREEVLEFMRAVKDLQQALQFLTSANSANTTSNKKIVSGQNLLRMSRKRLSREFFSLLKTNKDQLYSKYDHTCFSDDHNNNNNNDDDDDATSKDASVMADLKLIADCMMSAGFTKKCLKVYRLARKSFVEDAVLKLGVRKLKKSQVVKMDWDTIEAKMNNWMSSVRYAVMHIFSGEKIVCDYLFSTCSQPSLVTESIFSDVCKDSALLLFRIPGKLAKHSKKSPDKLFKFLELYETIAELSSEVDRIFASELTSSVRAQARSSASRITEAVRTTLADFEASIQKDNSKNIVPGGGVHQLTRHVMTYFSNLIHHTAALDKILADYPASLQSPLPESYFEGETTTSPVALHFAWLILVLLCKLDAKSELYKDVSLSYLFLANNLQYVVKKVRGTKLFTVLGEKWVTKHGAKVSQYAANYERNGWGRVIAALPCDLTVEIPLDKVKESFKRFNSEFEEEYHKQVDWVVQDPKLREEIKSSIRKKVDARYRKVYEKYRILLAKNRERGKIESVVKFTPEDLENYLSDLLDGPDADDPVSCAAAEMSSEGGSEAPGLQRRRRRLLLLIRQQ
ncbi:exocyst complex component EXO70H1-like [Silene latifolia]|uniref:exocyst complex component EXO70H1-like n=1 Tax=Silene latifolia TaxID=37657 RepID=UPI003D779392